MAWNTRRPSKGPKQDFAPGACGLRVGFIDGLECVDKVRTPRDGRPDFYVLIRRPSNVWYAFQPNHGGLVRCDSYSQACEAF